MTEAADVTLVIPTLGRPSLGALLRALADGHPLPRAVLLVDDRRGADRPLLGPGDLPPALAASVRVLAGRGAGPAAARNVGWRAAATPWVAFLDDDVLPPDGWFAALLADLAGCPPDVGGCQGRLVVPLPKERPPTDWERNVAGLEKAKWATADLAYRRDVLAAAGGFDERFRRAYREDADLGLRVTDLGWRIPRGERWLWHPVRPADRWVSVRLQRGNADDVLMRVLHGPDWRDRAGVPRGRRRRHHAATASLAVGVVGGLAGRRGVSAAGLAGYAGEVAAFAWARIAPGPRTRAEVTTMAVTSAVLPLAATWHWLAGWARIRRRLAGPAPTLGEEQPSVVTLPSTVVELPA